MAEVRKAQSLLQQLASGDDGKQGDGKGTDEEKGSIISLAQVLGDVRVNFRNTMLHDPLALSLYEYAPVFQRLLVTQSVYLARTFLQAWVEVQTKDNVRTEPSIGVIGCGTVGQLLLESLVQCHLVSLPKIHVSTRRPDLLDRFAMRGIQCYFDNERLVRQCDLVFLCCLPSHVPVVTRDITGVTHDRQLIVTVVAGLAPEKLYVDLESRARVLRVHVDRSALFQDDVDTLTSEHLPRFDDKVRINTSFLVDPVVLRLSANVFGGSNFAGAETASCIADSLAAIAERWHGDAKRVQADGAETLRRRIWRIVLGEKAVQSAHEHSESEGEGSSGAEDDKARYPGAQGAREGSNGDDDHSMVLPRSVMRLTWPMSEALAGAFRAQFVQQMMRPPSRHPTWFA